MSRYIDAGKPFAFISRLTGCIPMALLDEYEKNGIDIVRCKECIHRPIKEDADGDDYGFNLIEPNDGDERCPCLVDDGWYSWMPPDNFFCGYGEREGE